MSIGNHIIIFGIVGCMLIDLACSRTHGSSSYPQMDSSLFMPYSMPMNPAAYGQTGTSYNSGNSCGKLPVIEVLDSIFCEHVNKESYSSTVSPSIDVVIRQLKLAKNLAVTFDVVNYISAAISELNSLQDAVQANYEDSSLLKPYFEFISSNSKSDTTAGSVASSTGVEASANDATDATTLTQTRLAKMHKIRNEMQTNSTKFTKASKEGETLQDVTSDKESKTSKANTKTLSKVKSLHADMSFIEQRSGGEEATKDASGETTKSDTLAGRNYGGNSDYNDYTCDLVPPIYCPSDKYDDILYNVAEHIWRAVNFLFEASFQTFIFMDQLDCSTGSFLDRFAFQQAAISYGSLLTSIDTLIDIASDVQRIYIIVELDQSDTSSYLRSAGDHSQKMQNPSMPPNSGQAFYRNQRTSGNKQALRGYFTG